MSSTNLLPRFPSSATIHPHRFTTTESPRVRVGSLVSIAASASAHTPSHHIERWRFKCQFLQIHLQHLQLASTLSRAQPSSSSRANEVPFSGSSMRSVIALTRIMKGQSPHGAQWLKPNN